MQIELAPIYIDFPPTLPGILDYLMASGIVIYALPRRPVMAKGGNGATDAHDVTPRIPCGAVAWRLHDETDWRPMNTLPKQWLPYLNRTKGSPLPWQRNQ